MNARTHTLDKNSTVTLTARDRKLLEFLTRYRYATYAQTAAALTAADLSTSVAALRQRMPRLAKAGLVRSDNAGVTPAAVWRPTELGVRLSGLNMTTPTLSWATAAHTLGLVDLGIRFEALGESVVTEREIRAEDSRYRPTGFTAGTSRPPRYVVTTGRGADASSHTPDLVIARPPIDGYAQSVMVELEFSRKPTGEYRKILLAYREAAHVGAVLYYTSRPDIAALLTGLAEELGMSAMLTVREFSPSDESGVVLRRRGD